MQALNLLRIVPAGIALVAAVAFAGWVGLRPDLELGQRVPGQDGFVATAGEDAATVLKGSLTASGAAAPELPGAWPRFRGAGMDAISGEDVPLARVWKSGRPMQLWSLEVGEGYAGAAIDRGRVYLLDYDQDARTDVLRCLALADGREIWRRAYAVDISRNHGITRTVPALFDKYVVTLGPKCHVICVDAISGEFYWGIDLVREHKTTVPQWYAGQCPLIDEGTVILAPGGESLLIAVDIATGAVKWRTPNPLKWQMTHSSMMPMTLGGVKQYVYCASGGVVGVNVADGAILWEYPGWKVTMANVPSPVALGDDRVFLSGGYGAGSMILRVAKQGETFTSTEELRLKPEVFGAEQHTPILHEGHLYGVIPGGQMVCLDLTGKRLWASGRTRFGLGPYMLADGMIIALSDSATLSLIEATPETFKLVAQSKVLEEAHEAWGPLALAGGRLIARDLTQLVCLDLRKEAHE